MAKEPTPEKASEEKRKRKPREQGKLKSDKFSLRGVKDLRKQRELLGQEIERRKKETEKLEKQLNEINVKLKDDTWKELTKYFSDDEIKERLQQQGN